jgi:hypothetical protein
MHHFKHLLRLKFEASAASTSTIDVLPLYSGAISVIRPDTIVGGCDDTQFTGHPYDHRCV